MTTNFEMFKLQIDNAVDIIEKASVVEKNKLDTLISRSKLVDTNSLLERCEITCQKYDEKKPLLRIIFHLACSGGSLISKCLSAMPNVFLLSEVHPHTYRHLPENAQFLPSDIATLAKQANIPNSDKLAKKIFVDSIKRTYRHVEEQGGTLILRDHSHSDFCVGTAVSEQSIIVDLLSEHFDIIPLVTLRNPIDSYAALIANWWLHFEPDDFDSYCGRVNHFLAQFESHQIVAYESFVEKPQQVMKQMCENLQLPFDDMFEDFFDIYNVTGDSGRTSGIIAPRERRALDDELFQQIISSDEFMKTCEMYPVSSSI